MTRLLRGGLLLVCLLGCDPDPEPPPQPPPDASGRSIYAGLCAPCHGATGRGDGPMGRAIGATDLTDAAVRARLSDAWIREKIERGGERMPPVPGLSEREVAEVAAFVRALGEPP